MLLLPLCLYTGNHTVGIVAGKEDYDVLKISYKELFAEIIDLIDKGEIEVDNNKIPLEFYLSGDYKVTPIVLSLTHPTPMAKICLFSVHFTSSCNSFMADYACIYCKIHKETR